MGQWVKFAWRNIIKVALWMSWKERKLESLSYGTVGCFFNNPVDGGDEPVIRGEKMWRWIWDNG